MTSVRVKGWRVIATREAKITEAIRIGTVGNLKILPARTTIAGAKINHEKLKMDDS